MRGSAYLRVVRMSFVSVSYYMRELSECLQALDLIVCVFIILSLLDAHTTCGVPQSSILGPLLFILYILNDMPNCSKKLSFRIFADDTNVFYSSNSIDNIEKVMNEELQNVLQYCNVNRLSINIKKTNFMVITSCRKKTRRIKIGNFEQKSYIKYFGIYISIKF